MKSQYRVVLIILVAFLVGLAWIPIVIANPIEIDWQRFAEAYEPQEMKLFLPIIGR